MFFHKKIKKNTKNCFFEVKAAADKKGSFKNKKCPGKNPGHFQKLYLFL